MTIMCRGGYAAQAMNVTAHLPHRPTVEIRRGVLRPDWSAVTTPRARQALDGRFAARSGLLDRWAFRLAADEDLVWRMILQRFADQGHPPTRADIVAASGIVAGEIEDLLLSLRSHDLIDLDPATGDIKLAYPFTVEDTGHRVDLRGRVLHTLCAIDALGVADMCRADVTISSSCLHCGAAVRVETASLGKTLKSIVPGGAVVWYDFAYDRKAATSCCPAIAFFCSDEHMHCWLGQARPQRSGIGLAMHEALEVGRAIFGPVLAT